MPKASNLSFSLKTLADLVQGQIDAKDAELSISGLNTIEAATQTQIVFVDSPKYLKPLSSSKACAVLISKSVAAQAEHLPAKIVVDNPKWAFAKIMGLFYPQKAHPRGLHASVVVGEGSSISSSASIGPYCVIGERVHIGDGVILGAQVNIGDDCVIADNTRIHSNVTLYSNVLLGESVVIHSGAILGSDGFGFAQGPEGWFKIPQIGGLKIGKHCEIGANTTIDRGAIEDTIIGDCVIIDNLVHIAHNVQIGDFTAIAACVGIAGSAKIGSYCQIGGGSIINGHITIVDGSYFIGGSQVSNSIKKPGLYSSGIPAKEYALWVKNVARFHQLDHMSSRLKSLENKLKAENV